MSDSKGIGQDKLKLHFLRPEGEISRRELFSLVVPRYEVIPFIDSSLCQGSDECGLCLDACPLEAIKAEDGQAVVDTTLCSGCGACVAGCPNRAVDYPTFSLEQLDREIGRLLSSEDTFHKHRIMAFVCQTCIPVTGEDGEGQIWNRHNLLSLRIPCLAMASPWLMLRAFERGARGLVLLSDTGKCPVGFESNRGQEAVRFVQGLLECWEIEPARMRIINIVDDFDSVTRELEQFAGEIAGLYPSPFGVSEPGAIPDDGLLLPSLIKELKSKLGEPSKKVVTAGSVPFGKLVLDGDQCTGCGACTVECPTGALTGASSEEADVCLNFRHDSCVACGRCVAVCPEECLHLEKVLELDKMDCPPETLFRDKFFRCSECGAVIGPTAMIDNLRTKLKAKEDSLVPELELCPVCKVKQLGLRQTVVPSGTARDENPGSMSGRE